jgi:hypothetical protein
MNKPRGQNDLIEYAWHYGCNAKAARVQLAGTPAATPVQLRCNSLATLAQRNTVHAWNATGSLLKKQAADESNSYNECGTEP